MPDHERLSCPEHIESLREDVYMSLDDHCRQTYPEDPGRFSRVMLRLPSLRSIGLKCETPLFVNRLTGNTPVESFIQELLDIAPTWCDMETKSGGVAGMQAEPGRTCWGRQAGENFIFLKIREEIPIMTLSESELQWLSEKQPVDWVE